MDPVSVVEGKKHFSLAKVLQTIVTAGRYGAQAVRSVPPLALSSYQAMSLPQKVLVFTLIFGGSAVMFMSKYFKRKTRRPLRARNLRAASRRARQLSLAEGGGSGSAKRHNTSHNWIELQQKAKVSAEKESSVTSAATLVDGTPLTPQQLGLMGMEALETVVSYWEDALATYQPINGQNHVLTTAEEAAFIKMLENILEVAYNLQEESEHMFINQGSILNRPKSKLTLYNGMTAGGDIIDGSCMSIASRGHLLSVSSVDLDSFVSAQDTIADLNDFEDLNEIKGETSPNQVLYLKALQDLEKDGIPYRQIRTDFVGCANDTEYLAKMYCLRLAFSHIMSQPSERDWWVDNGRKILGDLMIRSDKDPTDFVQAYDDLLEFLSSEENMDIMMDELKHRNVQCCNFYDIVLDYILVDSFEDLESPPSSVLAVMNNRWLSNGFKETALHTAIWSVTKAKRKMLQYSDGFKSRFYTLSEILMPTLAWGFFGPDESLNSLMNYFKDQVLGFIHGLYDSSIVRFTSVEELSKDIMLFARAKFDETVQHIATFDEAVR